MLGDKIRELRKSNNLTQTELAEELNSKFNLKIDRVMVSKWERGCQVPVLYTISCLAKIFNVSIDYLSGQKTTTSEDDIKLTPHEISLVIAYRQNLEMQKSVDKLLGIEKSENIHIIPKVARSGNTEPIRLTDSEIQKLTNLPDLSPEDN